MTGILRHLYLSIILILFVTLSLASMSRESLTFDEPVHTIEGLNAWEHHSFAIDPYNPPFLKELHALPLILSHNAKLQNITRENIFPARIVTILLGALCIIGIYVVSAGKGSLFTSVFAGLLLAFEPNFLGNSHYVSLDIGTVLFFFLAYCAGIFAMEHRSWRSVLIASIFTGLAFASRLLTIPFLLLSFLFYAISIKLWKMSIKSLLVRLFVSIGIGLFTIWAVYFFTMEPIIVKHDNPNRMSIKIITYAQIHHVPVLAQTMQLLQNQPVLLGNFIGKVKNTFLRNQQTSEVFFLGQFYPKQHWYMMPITIVLKTPIPLQLLFLLGCFSLYRKRQTNKKILQWGIPIFIIVGMSMTTSIAPLIRYMLPIYPFVVMIATYGAYEIYRKSYTWALCILFFWYIGGTLLSFPHFITYANEFVGSRKYEKFTDSNLDWGQGLITLSDYIHAQQPQHIRLSYFGQDDPDLYGFTSNHPYQKLTIEGVCAFYPVEYPHNTRKPLTIMSVSNWYRCGYYKDPRYQKKYIQEVVADSFFVYSFIQ